MKATHIHTFYTNEMSHEYVGIKSGQEYYVTGHITSDDVDLYRELVPETEFDQMIEQIKSGNIKLDLDHSHFKDSDPEGEIPYGAIVDAKKVKDQGKTKIWIKAKLNKNHKRFQEVWKSIQDGFLDGFSIAYRAVKENVPGPDGIMISMLKGLKLLNVAMTGVPVNMDSDMTSSFFKALGKTPGVQNNMEKTDLKSKDKDGSHAHTKEDPLGEHNHPEIEMYIKDEINWVNNQLESARKRLDSFDEYLEKVNMGGIDEDVKEAAHGGMKGCKKSYEKGVLNRIFDLIVSY